MEDNKTINDPIMSAVEKSLFASADLVSSGDSGLESAISSSIESIKKGQESSASRINTTFGDLEKSAVRTGVSSTVNATEGRRGFATQTAVLRNILDTTNDELKGLRTQREELLLAGEAEAASQISGLMVKQAEARQKAMQQSFENMLGLGQFQQGNKGLQLQRDQFKETVKQNIVNNDFAKVQEGIQMLELAYNRADNEFERGIATERINIQKSELALSQARLTIAQKEAAGVDIEPSEGFKDLEMEGQIRAVAASGLSEINDKLSNGTISDEEALAQKLSIFNGLSTQFGENIVETEALLGVMGLPVAESAEASQEIALADIGQIREQEEAERQQARDTRRSEIQRTVPSNVPFVGGVYSPDLAGETLPII